MHYDRLVWERTSECKFGLKTEFWFQTLVLAVSMVLNLVWNRNLSIILCFGSTSVWNRFLVLTKDKVTHCLQRGNYWPFVEFIIDAKMVCINGFWSVTGTGSWSSLFLSDITKKGYSNLLGIHYWKTIQDVIWCTLPVHISHIYKVIIQMCH